MQIFELYFNPENKEKLLESFVHQPKNAYERKLGKIYMVGEILEISEEDSPLLQNIFHIAKEKYYKDTSLLPEKALEETLKKINLFLEDKGYQGKMNIALLSSKNFSIHVARIGKIKIVLLASGKIKNICEDLSESQGNVFHNIISGKMKKEDKLLVLTPEIYHSFVKGKLFQEMMEKPLSDDLMEKISSLQKEKFPAVSGLSLIMDHALNLEEKPQIIAGTKKKTFSFQKLFNEVILSLSKIKKPDFKTPKINISKKPLTLLSLLLLVVSIGYLTISIENNIRTGKQMEALSKIEENIAKATEEKNIAVLKEILDEIEDLKKSRTNLSQEINDQHSLLESKLLHLSQWEKVEDIELIKSFEDINPENFLLAENRIYLFTSESPELFALNLETREIENKYSLVSDNGITLSSFSQNKPMFYAPPKHFFSIEGGALSTSEISKDDQDYISLSSFLGVPYFLQNNGEIVSYRNKYPGTWLEKDETRIKDPLALAIDGSIFVLDKINKTHRYYKGRYEEKINYSIFPPFRADKIKTSYELPLFFLDVQGKRIIIGSKEGKIEKQLYLPELTNPKDIAITSDGKKIYLLDNQEIYLIEI